MNEQALPSASTTAKYTVSLPLPNYGRSKSFTTLLLQKYLHIKRLLIWRKQIKGCCFTCIPFVNIKYWSSNLFITYIWRLQFSLRKVSVFGVMLVQMRENADQNNSNYRHFLRSVCSLVFKTFTYNIWKANLALGISINRQKYPNLIPELFPDRNESI